MSDKAEMINEYIGLTFPYQMRDAMQDQENIIATLVEGEASEEDIQRQKDILEKLLSSHFQDSLMKVMQEGLETLDDDEIRLACLHERTMRKMNEISLELSAKFQELVLEKNTGES